MRQIQLAALLLPFAISCSTPTGDDNPDGTPDAGTLSSDAFIQKIDAAICGIMTKCSNIAKYQCSDFTPTDDLAKAIKAGRVKYDAAKAGACVSAITSGGCDMMQGGGEPVECMAAMTGAVAVGGNCYMDDECLGGSCDYSSTCPGKCVAFLANGAPCGTGVGDCDRTKQETCNKGFCKAPAAAAAACGGSDNCQTGLVCVNDVCSARGIAGADCTDSSRCAAAFFCEETGDTGKCAPRVATAGTCGQDTAHIGAAVSGQCAQGLSCAGLSVNLSNGAVTPGKCSATMDEGTACTPGATNTMTFSGCAIGLVCAGAKCAKPPTSGTCSGDPSAQCMTGYFCDAAKTCQKAKAVGADCVGGSSGECADSYCNTDTNKCETSGTNCKEP